MADIAGEATRAVDRPAALSHSHGNIWALTLGSVGVVYGDIGTSPLYAFRVAVKAAAESGPVTRDLVLGVLSLIVWALVIVVTIKYVLVLAHANFGRTRKSSPLIWRQSKRIEREHHTQQTPP